MFARYITGQIIFIHDKIMAYTPCSSQVTKNIADSCEHPIVGGYTGRAVLIPVGEAVFTQLTSNPRQVTGITLGSGNKTIAVNNVFAEPFTGSTTASQADSGRMQHTKTLAFRIPLRGAGNSQAVVEALEQSALGFVAVVEKKDKVGDGSFEVIGLQQGLKVNADGISRDEASNGGDISCTMSCIEPWFEAAFFIDGQGSTNYNYADTLAAFETLYTDDAM